MIRIDWRAPAAYRHTKNLPAAGFAWEYLRRNGDYRRDFQKISAARADGGALEAFVKRWGLRFPQRSRRRA